MKEAVLILDFGGVVFHIDTLTFEQWILDKRTKQSPDNLREIVSQLYIDYEKGLFDRNRFIEQLQKNCHLDFEADDFIKAWSAIWVDDVIGMKDLMENMNQKIDMVGLSNSNDMHVEYCFSTKPQLKLLRKIYLSHELGLAKPDPRIYELVQKDLQVSPESILFFDDREDNIAAAKQAGWNAHVFQSADQIQSIIDEL